MLLAIVIIILFMLVAFFYFNRGFKIISKKLPLGTYTTRKITVPQLEGVRRYIAVVRHGSRYPSHKVFRRLSPKLRLMIGAQNVEQLTPFGRREMEEYGSQLRQTYPHIFGKSRNFTVVSTTVQRAFDSAQECLNGIGMSSKQIQFNDPLLKLYGFFIKCKAQPKIDNCQWSQIMGVQAVESCSYEQVVNYEKERNKDTLNSMKKNSDMGANLAKHIREHIAHSTTSHLHFAHDSTLAALYWNLGLVDQKDWSNGDWLPFAARLEIFMMDDGSVRYFVNGVEKTPRI